MPWAASRPISTTPSATRPALIDPDNNRTTFIYDALNRKVETIDPLNNTTTYVYDALDRLISTTDALGRVTTYAYDADSRLVGETWHDSSASRDRRQTLHLRRRRQPAHGPGRQRHVHDDLRRARPRDLDRATRSA